jgi:hypothetical protein
MDEAYSEQADELTKEAKWVNEQLGKPMCDIPRPWGSGPQPC